MDEEKEFLRDLMDKYEIRARGSDYFAMDRADELGEEIGRPYVDEEE